jgi:hypothetical protein
MKTALCILCISPNEDQLEFYNNLSYQYDIFFICDKELDRSTIYKSVKIINIDNNMSLLNGYRNANTAVMPKTPIAWDKAIYYFSQINLSYDFVWFIEEDVLVPSIKTIPNIDAKYGSEDLLVASHISYEEEPLWLHWKEANFQINKPYYKSMVCAVRVSRKLLECIKTYVSNKKKLFFIELLFNTIAYHNNLKIKTIPELSTITFEDTFENIVETNLYHPFKDLNKQTLIHNSFKS